MFCSRKEQSPVAVDLAEADCSDADCWMVDVLMPAGSMNWSWEAMVIENPW